VEIDYSSNEIGAALAGILGGNGNYIERVLGPHLLVRGRDLATLAPLVQASLSRRLHRHYRGFAAGVLRDADAAEHATAKKILYVLRTALTGVHALAAGRIVTDVNLLAEAHGFGEVRELVELKRAGERVLLEDAARDRWRGELARAFALLDGWRARSPLPDEAPNRAELEAWLIELRLSRV
jgi:uncharacterized protein